MTPTEIRQQVSKLQTRSVQAEEEAWAMLKPLRDEVVRLRYSFTGETMSIREQYGLMPVINARGTYTPLGVSRSSEHVGRVVAEALGEFFVIDELQTVVSQTVARLTGAEAGAVTHCVASGITLSIAGAMAGDTPEGIAALPDAGGIPNRVVLPVGHAIDYGHAILTDIRLAGATPVIAGSDCVCTVHDIEVALDNDLTACLLLVSSRLVKGPPVDLEQAVAAAHRRGVPAIIDGAAQDMRIEELLATGADIVLVSAHKYMASPTAGLIIGRKALVQACRAHERGIGRAMKATKEAIFGVLAALDERRNLDLNAWRAEQARKVSWFIERANEIHGIRASTLPDPVGMPFSRVCLTVDSSPEYRNAAALANALREGVPSIWLMEHAANEGRLVLELVPLAEDEMRVIIERVAAVRLVGR
ncbi:MAG: aminotransferase class V-fold PLP-dependent enzyme [Gammaproteobacteria bacterium]